MSGDALEWRWMARQSRLTRCVHLQDDVMSPPEAQQDTVYVRNALQSYNMKPDAQAIFMFTRRHLMLTVELCVWWKKSRRTLQEVMLIQRVAVKAWLSSKPENRPE
jgi:hypothetical protein